MKTVWLLVISVFLVAGTLPTLGESAPGTMWWPVAGPVITPFGLHDNSSTGAKDFHPGIDIRVNAGTHVKAAAGGIVTMAEWYGGYGNYILINHGGGISTAYAHLSRVYVKVGQQVSRGETIAASGNTGESQIPHLHFEVRENGKPVNPIPFLQSIPVEKNTF